MLPIQKLLLRAGKALVVVGAGLAAGMLVPFAAYENAAAILGSFAGVVVAALVPTMILAATILRPLSRGKNEFASVRQGVSNQISFFSGLFLLTVLLVVLLFIGAMLGWTETVFVIRNPTIYGAADYTVPIGKIVGGSIVALATLIAIQMIAFVQGIKELFLLHAENTERELDQNIRSENDASMSADLPADPRTGIGEIIGELRH